MGAQQVTVRLRRQRIGGGLRVLAVAVATAATARASAARAGKAKAAPVLVDINAADRATLKTLPGVGDAEAAKIAAGRPYLTKAELVTKSVLPAATYQALKRNVIAGQDPARPRGARVGR